MKNIDYLTVMWYRKLIYRSENKIKKLERKIEIERIYNKEMCLKTLKIIKDSKVE